MIFDKVAVIIAEQKNIDVNLVKPDSTLETLGVDSIDRVEILIKIEEQFSIEIKDEDSEKLHSVQQLADYVDNLVKSK